jgi:protein SCO1
MKLHHGVVLVCGIALSAVVAAVCMKHLSAASASIATAERCFEVKGRIRSFEADGKTVHIAHEEIPGFMPAMEMPFTVKDASLLKGLTPGDLIEFQLLVNKDDSWITTLKRTSGPAGPAAAMPATPAGSEEQPIEPGQQVPDFALIDQHGRPLHFHDFHGKAVVLTLIYTRCPLPNFCPLMSKKFASLQKQFGKQLSGKVQLLSISFDPEFDTPETLQRYASLYQQDDKNWTFATGTPAQINAVTGVFGLIREPSNGFINHDLRTALISPGGKLVHVWRSNIWTPSEVYRMVQETLQARLASKG